MKSFFTKLGTLLLCGVAVAVVGCTDFSQDIQAVDKKVDDLTQNTETDLATINKALKDLEAKITADFATKKEVADLKATLEGSLASQVEALTGQINDVNDALKAAESKVNAAVAELDSKKADKTAVDAAIADAKAAAEKAVTELQGKLEAAQAELEKEIEGVTAEIADVQKNLDEAKAELEKKLAEGDAALQEDIDQAHAKADQLFGQLEALAPYLETLQAQILENKGTLDALSAYLPELKAELEEEIDNVDAKALELKNDLLSLTAHLKEYEAANDAKVLELKGTLDALSAHLGEYEKTTDAKLTELQNTFFALSAYLEEQFAAIEAADDAIYEEIASNFAATNSAITALNNLLEDLQGEMKAADDAIYEEIASNFAATNSAITALNNLLEDLTAEYKAADEAIYAEMAANFATTNEAISSVYAQHLELAARVDGIDASLKAQIAAFEAFKAAYEEKVAELEATDTDLYGQYTALQEAITSVNNLIEDLQKEDENLASEINGVRENLTQLMNSINDRIDTEVEALKADALQKFNGLISIIAATEDRMNDKFEHVFDIVAELDERVAANESAIAALKQTVEMLEMWAEAHGTEYNQLSQLVANIYTLTGEIEERVDALEVEDGQIYKFIGETATNLNNLIEDVNTELDELWAEVAANKNECGAAVLALQNLIADLEKTLTGRIAALENRVDKIEIDIEDLKAALKDLNVALEEGLAETLEEAFKNDEGVMGNVRAFEEKVSNIVEKLNAKDAQIDSTHAADIAAIVVTLSEIKAELADIAEWQVGINTTINQLSEELWEAIGLQETALENAKTDLENAYKAADEAIKEQIVNGLADVIAAAIAGDEKLDAKINDLVGKIQTEFNQKIQSVVYVPELGMTIPGEYFTFDGDIIEGSKVTLNAKFQVEPAGLISRIEKGELSVDLRTVKTKAYTNASTVELIFDPKDKDQGIFEVKATFPAEEFHKDAAVALFVYDYEVAAPKGDEVSIDFSNAVTSEYVKTEAKEFDLKGNYRLVKKDGNTYVPHTAVDDDEVQWSASAEESLKAPFAGYEVMIEKDTDYLTLDEVAALAGVEVATITPKYVGTITYKDELGNTEATCKVQTVLNADDKPITDFQFDIIRPEGGITKANAKNFVKHSVTAKGDYIFGTTKVIADVDYKYTIINRQIFVEFEDRVVDWTYDLAEKLSTTKTKANAYNKNLGWSAIPANQNYESFREIPVNVLATGDYTIKDIVETMQAVTDAQVKFFLNDQPIVKGGGEPYFNFNFTAYSTGHQLAFANIVDYAFTPGKDNVYNMRREYEIAADYTDIIVKFKATLTGMPADQTYDLGLVELPMNSEGYIVKPIEATNYFFTNTPAGEFADAATFNAAFYAEQNLTTFAGSTAFAGYPAVRWDNSVTPAKGYSTTNDTHIKLTAANEFLRLSTNGDLKKATDSFQFDNNYEAWYGVNYRVKASAKVVLPNYSIAPVDYWVKDGVVNVPGHMTAGVWVIDDMKPNTYVQVLGVDKASTDILAVYFTTVTKDDATKGIKDVPAFNHYKEYNPATNTIADYVRQWGAFTGREFDTKATLVMKKYSGAGWTAANTVELGSVDLKFVTDQMLEVSAADVALERNGQPEVSSNFWKGLTVYGKDVNDTALDYQIVDGKKVQRNLVTSANKFFNAAITKYGLDLKFDKSTLKIYVDGVLTPDFPTTNYSFDEASGTLTFKSNEATLQKPIRFEVEATITYTRDYEHKDAFKQTLSIVVSK